MAEAQAFLNGRFLGESQVSVSVHDAGFVQGTTVAEQLRSFAGRLFEVEHHVQRLFHSLEIIGVDPGLSLAQFIETAHELARRNHALLPSGDDLGLTIFVTPGPYPAMSSASSPGPTVCLHTFPLRFGLWAAKYERGERLATTDVAQVPRRSWPTELKCRSRMHYYLADRQAAELHPLSRALLLDDEGFVTETTTANIVVYRRDLGLLSPPAEKILPGISLAVLIQLADKLGLAHEHRDLLPADVAMADEVLLTSTSPCVLPVCEFNGGPIGSGKPGPMFARLIRTWSELVGVDIVAQARQFAAR